MGRVRRKRDVTRTEWMERVNPRIDDDAVPPEAYRDDGEGPGRVPDEADLDDGENKTSASRVYGPHFREVYRKMLGREFDGMGD